MADALFALCVLICAGLGALFVADAVVGVLERRPQTRFGRALAALERASGTHPEQ